MVFETFHFSSHTLEDSLAPSNPPQEGVRIPSKSNLFCRNYFLLSGFPLTVFFPNKTPSCRCTDTEKVETDQKLLFVAVWRKGLEVRRVVFENPSCIPSPTSNLHNNTAITVHNYSQMFHKRGSTARGNNASPASPPRFWMLQARSRDIGKFLLWISWEGKKYESLWDFP